MIRINLVAEGRKPVVARRAKEALGVEETSLGEWLLIGSVLLALLISGVLWWHYDNEIEERTAAIQEAEAEVEELQAVLDEVEAFKQKKAELEHKISVINELKANQRGPVRIMDALSRALPESLWLDQLELKSNTVTLTGRAFNVNQIAQFIENLNQVPQFQEPELLSSQREREGGVYNFNIRFDFSFVEELEEETEEGEEAEETLTEEAAAAG